MAKKQTPPPTARPPSLPPDQAAKLLRVQYEKGKSILQNRPIDQATEKGWKTSAQTALEAAFGTNAPNVQSFAQVGQFIGSFGGGNEQEWERNRAERMEQRLSMLEGLIELLETQAQLASPVEQPPQEQEFSNRVFLVHGHDEAVLQGVARFLESLDLEPLILREQPNKGRTIIEKFIDYADVGFAVVLLTGDDRGGVKTLPYEEQSLRARQNVVLELGYFLGKLGRMRVCALHQKGVEIPSDYSGVVFVPLDDGGGWKLSLAKEMKSVGLSIDMNKAI